jgi:hypothetical protein
MCRDEAQVQLQLERLKRKLSQAVAEADSFVDPKVIEISEEMDQLIVLLQKHHINRTKA